jgi:hypothetical protein
MPKIFKFYSPEGEVDVPRERWCWVVIYNDGTELHQFDEPSLTFHQLKEIDQTKLAVFRMIRDDGLGKYDLAFNPAEMKLVHFYINSVLRNGDVKLKSYCFGYEKNVEGVAVKSLATILPDGNLTLSDDRLNLMIDVPEQ